MQRSSLPGVVWLSSAGGSIPITPREDTPRNKGVSCEAASPVAKLEEDLKKQAKMIKDLTRAVEKLSQNTERLEQREGGSGPMLITAGAILGAFVAFAFARSREIRW